MSTIVAIIERETEFISRFIALLKDEQEALKRGDATGLPELASGKIALVNQLNDLENKRLLALGIDRTVNSREAMDKWLAEHPEQDAVASNWTKLLELASEAKQFHELNASLVAMHLQQTSEALAILTRQSEQNSLYGSDGQTAQSSGSRIVDSA